MNAFTQSPRTNLNLWLAWLTPAVLITAWLAAGAALLTYSPLDAAWSTNGQAGLATQNSLGKGGAWLADFAFYVFGKTSWLAWLWAGVAALRSSWRGLAHALALTPPAAVSFAAQLSLLPWLVLCAALEGLRFYGAAGLPMGAGGAVAWAMQASLQPWAQAAWFSALLLGLIIFLAQWVWQFSWLALAERLVVSWESQQAQKQVQAEYAQDLAAGEAAAQERVQELVEELREVAAQPALDVAPPKPQVVIAEKLQAAIKMPELALIDTEVIEGQMPPLRLLDAMQKQQSSISPETIELTSRLIERKLKDFNVTVRVVNATPGPVITRYEIELADGVKGSQIVNLSKDLSRVLALPSIRVEEIIVGKTTMGLELPNPVRQMVRLSELLASQIFVENKDPLTVALGKDITGEAAIFNLARAPHTLVAGTTGSGKSVGVNAMLLSLLYRHTPEELRLILIDPKQLEMAPYEDIPHLLCPVVTDMRLAIHGLNWALAEMERRATLMAALKVKELKTYNQKIQQQKRLGKFIPNPFSLTPQSPEPLNPFPHILIVIDELADLMMVEGKKIEDAVVRLAQKARASGIHLLLATQRPSVDVVTGLIKANVPARMAFKVSSKIDSRTILDQGGAESLLGMGDMLVAHNSLPKRIHGAFVGEEEVIRVTDFWRAAQAPNYVEDVLEPKVADELEAPSGKAVGRSTASKIHYMTKPLPPF